MIKTWSKSQEEKKQPEVKFLRYPKYTLSNLILDEDIKESLISCLAKIRYHDLIYNVWEVSKIDGNRQNSITINFYGPPGTGKTVCAEALAHELGKRILEITCGDLISSTMGDTAKNVTSIFKSAKENNCVLFIDEADSLLDNRSPSSDQGPVQELNRAKSVLLKELDACNSVVIFATNNFQSYDQAFVRRILSHIEFKLPGIDNRKKIFDLMLSKKVPGRENLDFDEIALQSDGLSGADIKSAIIMALTTVAITEQQILEPKHILDKIKEIKISKEKHNSNNITTREIVGEEREQLMKRIQKE